MLTRPMIAQAIDLDAYFRRIHHDGPRTPTLATLQSLQERHPQAIPFENVDVLLDQPIRLDLASLQQKLVHDGRGGYCFEQNALFAAVLRQLGFRVTTLSGRVRWNVSADAVPPRTHMVLRVDLDEGPYLADVGFGGLVLTRPLSLRVEGEQATPHEPHRIVVDGPRRLLQAKLDQTWKDVYELTLEEQFAIDYEVANWFTSTSPQSRFRQNLLVTRAGAPGQRYMLFNAELVSREHGRVERRPIETPEALLEALDQVFGLRFPSGTRIAWPGAPWAPPSGPS